MVRRADERNSLPTHFLQNLIREDDVFVGVGRLLFQDDCAGGHTVGLGNRFHHLGFTQRKHKP
jgi:hypothetical protein